MNINNMYILLTLFFTSLFSIIFMIGRKLPVQQNGQISNEYINRGENLFEFPYIKEIRYRAVRSIRKYGHLSLVIILRLYIRSTNFFKYKYEEIKIRIKKRYIKTRGNAQQGEKNNFLKKISSYKNRIRQIKHKIYEEEKDS